MWYQIAIIFALVILLGLAFWAHLKEGRRDDQILRHTIKVNLSILQSELTNLFEFAQSVSDSTDKQKALGLLNQASATVCDTGRVVDMTTGYALEVMLGEVFDAMVKVTEARRLLNAIGV